MRRFVFLAAAALAAPSSAMARDSDRLDALEQQLRDAHRQLEQLKAKARDDSAALADIKRASSSQYADLKDRLKKEPAARFDHGRFTFVSANGDFSLALRSTVQFDAGYFAQGRNPSSVDLNSGINFRRAQFGFAGTAWRDWSYNFTYDFGGTGVEQRGYPPWVWGKRDMEISIGRSAWPARADQVLFRRDISRPGAVSG